MLRAIAVLVFGGKGSPFLHYERQVRLRRQVANLEPAKRAPALILQMGRDGGQVCMSTGNDVIMKNVGANRIPHILDEHFAPDAIDAIYQVERSLHLKRTNQTKFFS